MKETCLLISADHAFITALGEDPVQEDLPMDSYYCLIIDIWMQPYVQIFTSLPQFIVALEKVMCGAQVSALALINVQVLQENFQKSVNWGL